MPPDDLSREKVVDTGWRFWSRWTCAVGAGFGVALIGMGATISSGNGEGVVIEGIKVRLPTGTLMVLSDRQMADVRREIKSRL
jgi:hypothetical protein